MGKVPVAPSIIRILLDGVKRVNGFISSRLVLVELKRVEIIKRKEFTIMSDLTI